MAAVKLESENSEYQRARKLLEKAREIAPSQRIYLKSARCFFIDIRYFDFLQFWTRIFFRLEWCLEDLKEAKRLLKEAIELYPETPKLYLMMGQILWQEKNIPEARRYFSEGVRSSHC